MDTVKDIFESIISVVKDRLVNPFYGAFAIAWIFVNYEFLLVFFGSIPYLEKVEYIDNVIFLDGKAWLNGLLYPGLLALGYIFVTPFLYRAVSYYQRTIEKGTVEMLLKIAADTPISKDAAAALIDSAKRERTRLNATIDDLHIQMRASADLIESLTSENKGLKARVADMEIHEGSDDLAVLDISLDQELNPILESLRERSRSWRFDVWEKDLDDSFPSTFVKHVIARGFSSLELIVMYVVKHKGGPHSAEFISESTGLQKGSVAMLLDELQSARVVGIGTSHNVINQEVTKGFVLTMIGEKVLAAYSRRHLTT